MFASLSIKEGEEEEEKTSTVAAQNRPTAQDDNKNSAFKVLRRPQ